MELPPSRAENDRYVPPAEWATLTDEQKAAVQEARQARQKKSGGGKSGGNKWRKEGASKGRKTWQRASKFSTKALKKMVDRKVAAIMAKPKGNDSSEDEEAMEIDKTKSHQLRQKSVHWKPAN
jgi:hypothetical protein